MLKPVPFQIIQLSMNTDLVYTQLKVKTVLFQTIQFRVSTVSMSKTVPFSIQKQLNSDIFWPLAWRIRGIVPFPSVERERNSATGVRSCLLRFRSPLLLPLHQQDTLSM